MASKTKVAIVGAGGFGCEVFHLLNHELYECIGFIDHHDGNKSLQAPIVGHESEMEKIIEDFEISQCIIALGDMLKRKKIVDQIKQYQLKFPLVCDSSITNFSHEIGDGTILYPGVVIMNDCKIGQFTLLNSGVTLGHDVIIGNFCNINPGVHLAGRVTIGDGTLIGIGASIKEKVMIGKNAIIGAGSVVLSDVPDHTTVYGVPARPAKN
jgi:sugar O-acyltransferase (sialic acid O-acetyltransferase NeuD family)